MYSIISIANQESVSRDFMGIIFYGIIDETMIFNRALTTEEIQNIYNSQKLAMRVEPGKDEFFLKNLASILSAIQDIIKKIQALF